MIAFVDANVFVRLLIWDDPVKAQQCENLFQHVEQGEISLVTSVAIVAEVTFVLTSRASYNFARADVAPKLQGLLLLPHLHLDHKPEVLATLDLWASTSLDFPDCLAAGLTRQMSLDGIYSYDRGFDRVPDIRRLEP